MVEKLLNLRLTNSELIKCRMSLGGLSKDYDRDSCKNTELYGNAYHFSVDYSAVSNDKIHDTDAYLMRKSGII